MNSSPSQEENGDPNHPKVTFQRSQSDYISSSSFAHSSGSELTPTGRRGSLMGSSSDQRQSFYRMQSDEPMLAGLAASPRRKSLRYDASHTMDRLRSTFIADYPETLNLPALSSSKLSYESIDSAAGAEVKPYKKRKSHRAPKPVCPEAQKRPTHSWKRSLQSGLGQVPAVVLIGMFHLMIGIPFGVR